MKWPFHHKHKAKKNIASVPQTIQGLQLSSSAIGSALTLAYGQARLPGLLIHYKQNFLASGAGDPNTAAIAMALCEGPIAGVLKAYDGKDQTATQIDIYTAAAGQFVAGTTSSLATSRTPLAGTVVVQLPHDGSLSISAVVGSTVNFVAAIPIGTTVVVLSYQYAGSLATRGFTTFLGALVQAAWSFLTSNYPSEAVPYELTAYLANSQWPTPNGSLANWSFEVQALLQWGSGIVDANPKDIVNDFLTDPNRGALFPASLIASLTAFRDYCTASGTFLSPVYDTQAPAAQHLQELIAVANSALVWSDGLLKIIPYADQAITGNGVTYTPNTTPLYNLGDDDFISAPGDDPVLVTRRPQSDVYNQIRVEFDNRLNDYNGEIAEAKDQNSIELYGLRPAPVIKAPFIKDPVVARFVAQLALQRQVYIRNTYAFRLPFRYVLLEPMDLVTLTDANLGLNQTTVRLTEVVEEDDETFSCTAEEWPFGVATAAAYGTPAGPVIVRPTRKGPAGPVPSVTFDWTGQAILDLVGDATTTQHTYVLRTDRLPTAAETRAGTTNVAQSASGIATGTTVIPGASVYVGDLAYNVTGDESPLVAVEFRREGLSIDVLGRLKRSNPFDDGDFAVRSTSNTGDTAHSGVKDSTGSPINLSFHKPHVADPDHLDSVPDGATYGRPILTRLSSGKPLIDFSEAIHLNKQLDNIGDGTTYARILGSRLASGVIKRAGALDDGVYALRATETDGSTKTSTAHNPQGSFLPTPVDKSLFTYNSGGATSGQMWLSWTWPAFTIPLPDGSSISVPASSSLTSPPTPTLSQVAGGALSARTRFVVIGYTKNQMIYRTGAEASLAVSANNLLKVTSPASVAGYDGWVPLVGSSTLGEFTQSSVGAGGLAFGTDWTEPTTGADISGQTPYSNARWPLAVTAIGLNASSTFFYYLWWEIASSLVAFADRGQLVQVAASAIKQFLDGHIALVASGLTGITPPAGTTGSGNPAAGRNV